MYIKRTIDKVRDERSLSDAKLHDYKDALRWVIIIYQRYGTSRRSRKIVQLLAYFWQGM